ncbi:MAG: hypothetical protein J6Q55_00510, partial [Clostridia bacterium]|nr:hypothetical protein [Clostridia bacterium]
NIFGTTRICAFFAIWALACTSVTITLCCASAFGTTLICTLLAYVTFVLAYVTCAFIFAYVFRALAV